LVTHYISPKLLSAVSCSWLVYRWRAFAWSY